MESLKSATATWETLSKKKSSLEILYHIELGGWTSPTLGLNCLKQKNQNLKCNVRLGRRLFAVAWRSIRRGPLSFYVWALRK